MENAVFRDGLETAGVDDQVRPFPGTPLAVVAIACEAGQIGDERITRTRETIEERGFPHIGAPYEGNNGFHQMLFTVKRGSKSTVRVATPLRR
jgi:hypothetical protein